MNGGNDIMFKRPMSKRALNALEGSIWKWERIVNNTGMDDGTGNCPLCELYHETNCISCPVYINTALYGCEETPFDAWCDHHNTYHCGSYPRLIECDECRSLAESELIFLKSLLPTAEE